MQKIVWVHLTRSLRDSAFLWTAMSWTTYDSNSKPKSMSRAKGWTAEVENLYRFQQAGYRDELEYRQVKQVALIDKWPETGFVKKLQRRDDTFYYYSRKRECQDKEVNKVKVYVYFDIQESGSPSTEEGAAQSH